MTEPLNIISISCNVFFDAINHSKLADSEQIVCKNHVDNVFNTAFKYIGQTNHILLANGNGVEIAYAGPAEDAMLMATDILNGISIANKQDSAHLSACIGVHLEPLRVTNDFEEEPYVKPNIIGNGINAAKQIMCHAKPNEILVSRSYYENIPPSAQVRSTLFNDVDVKPENHVLDHQADVSDLEQNQAFENEASALIPPLTSIPNPQLSAKSAFFSVSNWRYGLVSIFILVALLTAAQLAFTPTETPIKKLKTLPLPVSQTSNLPTVPVEPEIPLNKSDENNVAMQEELEPPTIQENLEPTLPVNTPQAKTPLAKKEVKRKTKNRIVSTSEKSKPKQIISWQSLKKSIKQGHDNECTQAEIALNQCR